MTGAGNRVGPMSSGGKFMLVSAWSVAELWNARGLHGALETLYHTTETLRQVKEGVENVAIAAASRCLKSAAP